MVHLQLVREPSTLITFPCPLRITTGTSELPDETFRIPSTWYAESTLPSSGILSLTYFSGRLRFLLQ